MQYYPHRGAGNVTVAAALLAMTVGAVFAEAYGLIPHSNLYLLPMGYVVLRSLFHTAVSSAVREGYVMAAHDIAAINATDDEYEEGDYEADESEEGEAPTVLNSALFADRAKGGASN